MQPRVGVGVLIYKEGKILLGKRIVPHGKDMWSFPGGHLEYQEDLKDCAIRETKEETGIEVKDLEFFTVSNDVFPEKHYLTVFMRCNWQANEPRNLESDKCERWEWFSPQDLPEDLFLPVHNLLKTHNL